MLGEGYRESDFRRRASSRVRRVRSMRMPTRARGLMTRKFLVAATTVVALLLKVLLNMRVNEEWMQEIVLRIAAYFLGQDALSTADPAAA